MTKALPYVLALVILLYPEVIGEEEVFRVQPIAEPVIESIQPKIPNGPSQRYQQRTFRDKKPDYVDKEAFLESFKRQAQLELMACLSDWQTSPSFIVLQGTIGKNGSLFNVKPIPPDLGLPPCIVESIEAMDFSTLTGSMEEKSHQIQWKIDW
jgi:hypothetical protein